MNSNGPGRDTSRSHTSIIEPARLGERLWCTKFQSSALSIYSRSRPRSCLFSNFHTAPKYDTKRIRYVTLHFQDRRGAA